LLLGAILTSLNALWMSYMEIMWNQGGASLLALSYNAVFTLVVLLAANRVVGHVGIRPLAQSEMLLLFVMLSVGTGIAASTQLLVALLAYPVHFAHLDPAYADTLLPRLPRGLMVLEARAAHDYYLGSAVLGTWPSIRPWVLPFVGWGTFVVALVCTGHCLSSLVYNQWRHQERLPFPIIQIPLMITDPAARAFRSRLFWVAFGLAGGVNVLNALAMVYPAVPALAVKRQYLELAGLPRPWSAISPLLFSFNPLLIGLEFFLPLDMLFSVFFFYWAGRMQGVWVAYTGAETTWAVDSMVAPYVREQATGLLLALILYAFWVARGRWREAYARYPMPQSVRRSAAGAAAGAGVMLGILVLAGMAAPIAALFIAVYLLIALSAARIRAHYGPPSVGLMLGAPGPVLYAALGKDVLGTQGLSSLAVTHWLGREFSGSPVPPTLEAFALMEGRRGPGLAPFLILAAAAAFATSFGIAVVTGYTYGHGTALVGGTQAYFGHEAYMLFAKRLADPMGAPKADSLIATAAGACVTLGMQGMRSRFIGFPLHPVGYAVASSYIATYVWSTAIVVWAFKWMPLRYASLKGYYQAAPFFLGLLLGEFVVGSLISLIGVVIGRPVYVFWPY
jgi:hypothetical protein